MMAVVLAALFFLSPPSGFAAQTDASPVATIAPEVLARGRWALLFVVIPGCPACEHAIRWLGKVQHAHPQIRFLLVAPSLTEELEAAASQLGLPLVVDEGGRMGAASGVRRAPTVVLVLDGRPRDRLDWPFTQDELALGLEELAAAPRQGPWQFLGSTISLGEARTLEGEPVNLDEFPRPLLVLFFNPLCPPCWDALPGLVELSEAIAVVLVVLAPHTLTGGDREKLRQTGPKVAFDGQELARRLAVRATPTYVVVDQEGVIFSVHEGAAELGELSRAVMAALGEAGDGE